MGASARRGISGVMVSVLLTVIGIASVLIFWQVILPLITPRFPASIHDARVLVVGDKTFVSAILRNISDREVEALGIRVFGDFGNAECRLKETIKAKPGEYVTVNCELQGVKATRGNEYAVRVVYKPVGGATEPELETDALKVIAR